MNYCIFVPSFGWVSWFLILWITFFLRPKRSGPKTSTLSAIFKGLCCVFVLGCFMWTSKFEAICRKVSSPKNMAHLFGFTHSPSIFCLEIPPQREISESYFWLITLTLAIDTVLPLLGEPFLVSSSCHLHVTYGTTIFIPKMKVIGWTLNPYGSFIKVLSNLEPGLKKTSEKNFQVFWKMISVLDDLCTSY